MDKIESVNYVLNDILTNIFEDITVEIDLFKYIKSTKLIKPEFNIKYLKSGVELDYNDELSGGEKDCISIAITCAMAIIGYSKMIIFDESMRSLSPDKREKCIETISTYIKNKYVINVCHDTVEGCYDNVISLTP